MQTHRGKYLDKIITDMKERKTYYAIHDYEIIPCHLIARKDRIDERRYAANSKRDKRRFVEAFETLEEAQKKLAIFERYRSQPDTF